ncbi:DUF2164 domain-containing protein [Klebsiella sp. BIGb0407]|uniref:DUF2164 domain-containing protein n=1 Tax=Klebsiella sp. BIGb0407 TaxID=2940603 RepID=UPI0021689520|nr:DUF2164 domain-containing protein [Klebsiella sp. BIGb0407]MCS3429702.1 uncharacterized protein (DUF2164 family) [Klebsiella sp. BIGb0407]
MTKKITLPAEEYQQLSAFITKWLDDNHELTLGQFESDIFLDELVKKMAPILYNQGLDDAIKVAQHNMLTLEELLDLEKIVP